MDSIFRFNHCKMLYTKALPAICILLLSYCAHAQTEEYDTIPPYLKTHTIPAFELLRPDSTWFQSTSIPKNRPVVITYFSGSCGHCQHEAKELSVLMKKMPDVFFVMVSYHDTPADIADFARTYKLDKIPNLCIGRDPIYAIPSFFRVRLTPSLAVYDKQGNFYKFYEGGVDTSELEKALKSL